jgi:glycyl-tRNA synthetase beta chain
MTQMRKPIDTFFDKVMVMVEDEIIRNNRLALLDGIGRLFLKIADFSKLT